MKGLEIFVLTLLIFAGISNSFMFLDKHSGNGLICSHIRDDGCRLETRVNSHFKSSLSLKQLIGQPIFSRCLTVFQLYDCNVDLLIAYWWDFVGWG